MAEQLRAAGHPETHAEMPAASHERRERLARLEQVGQAQERNLRANTEHVRAAVEEQAISAAEYAPAERHGQPTPHHASASRELRAMTYQRALVRIRKRQSPTDKTLSKFIHHGAVDASSEALGKTIARPSAIMGGGLFALLGTMVLLFTARHYGFRFNFLMFVCLFTAGMLAGLLLEGAVRLARRRN